MSSELTKKLEKYRKSIEAEIIELKKEREELINKISEGDALTWKENKRNQKLAKLIKEKFDVLALFETYELCKKSQKDLTELNKTTLTKEEKDNLISRLVTNFKKINEKLKDSSLDIEELSEEEANDLESTKSNIENDIKELESIIDVLNKRNRITLKEERELKEKQELLEKIEEQLNKNIDVKEAEADFVKAANAKEKNEKTAILKKHKNTINNAKSEVTDMILGTMKKEKEIDKEELKAKTKTKLSNVSATLKNNWKKIAVIGGVVVTTIAIVAAANSCSRNDNNKSNKVGIETEYDNNQELIEELMKYGIDKNTAFQYATTPGFNIDYLNDYEATRLKYNITASEAVDYVNRAHEIEATNFYEGATIEQIVEVIMVIDDNELFMSENSALEQSINASLTDIYNKYAFENTSLENDAKRMEALKHFAKEGSELDKFLTKFSTLTIDVLNTKNNTEENNKAKNNMYTFLDTFANTFAGNTQDVNLEGNEEAVIQDTFEWNTAYHISSSLYSMFITEDRINDWICLQVNLKSNYEQWAQVNGCDLGESRTLGGE